MTSIVSQNTPLINPRYKPLVTVAAIATGLAAGAVCTPWEPVKIVGMTVLTGVGYGIANDMLACRDCIEYFTVGHFYDDQNLRYRPLNTLDPNLNAIAWGMLATWHVCAIAGAALAAVAQAPISSIKISATQLAPYLVTGAAVTILLAHVRSQAAHAEMVQNPKTYYWDVPANFQAKWEACNVRNLTGYAALGIGGIALSIAILAARQGLVTL